MQFNLVSTVCYEFYLATLLMTLHVSRTYTPSFALAIQPFSHGMLTTVLRLNSNDSTRVANTYILARCLADQTRDLLNRKPPPSSASTMLFLRTPSGLTHFACIDVALDPLDPRFNQSGLVIYEPGRIAERHISMYRL